MCSDSQVLGEVKPVLLEQSSLCWHGYIMANHMTRVVDIQWYFSCHKCKCTVVVVHAYYTSGGYRPWKVEQVKNQRANAQGCEG